MQALVYDTEFNLSRIIDNFTSFIWNDVYIGYGDFEIEFTMDENALSYIEEGNYVSIRESAKIMIIEKIEILTSFQNGNIVRISGRSLESILERRILRQTILAAGSLQEVILRMLNENIISPSNQNRKIDGFSVNLSSDPHITSISIDGEYKAGENLYSTIVSICEDYHIGFRIILHNEKFFQFELYMGQDRSYDQEENAWVVFSTQFENLEESNMTLDYMGLKNCIEIDFNTKENIIDPIEGDSEKDAVVKLSIGNDVKGLERREIYASSNFDVEAVDVESFGKPEDRVNKYDYMTWTLQYFDSSGYSSAMREWRKSVDKHIEGIMTPREKTINVYLKPGDPGYKDVGNDKSAAWVNTKTITVKETKEETYKRASKYLSYLEKSAPKQKNYEVWGWELTNVAGYNAAIAKAQEDINNEIKKAQEEKLNYASNVILQEGSEELSTYKTITYFDGKIDPNINFIYKRDYDLGDIVQIVNEYRFGAATRVVSVLFSQDNQNGIIVRPTFESDDSAKFDIIE